MCLFAVLCLHLVSVMEIRGGGGGGGTQSLLLSVGPAFGIWLMFIGHVVFRETVKLFSDYWYMAAAPDALMKDLKMGKIWCL